MLKRMKGLLLITCQRNLANKKVTNLKGIKDKCNSSRQHADCSKPQIRSNIYNLIVGVGFSTAAVGCFGADKPKQAAAGINFKMSPHYSPQESYENNLKAMVVAMMMTDKLEKDEVTFLTNAVDILYTEGETECKKKRAAWCLSEMKNYMICAEKYNSFQDDRCTPYRKMLKSCLQARKDAAQFVSNPSTTSTCKDKDPQAKPSYPVHRRHKHNGEAVKKCKGPAESSCSIKPPPVIPTPCPLVKKREPPPVPPDSEPPPNVNSDEMEDGITEDPSCPGDCAEICRKGVQTYDGEVDDATACVLEYEDWLRRKQCGCRD